jgi:small subunit ribosomal protein S1
VVKVGDKIEVKVLRVDTDERKIGLSRKRVEWGEEGGGDDGTGTGPSPTPKPVVPETELRGGTGGAKGPLFKAPDKSQE